MISRALLCVLSIYPLSSLLKPLEYLCSLSCRGIAFIDRKKKKVNHRAINLNVVGFPRRGFSCTTVLCFPILLLVGYVFRKNSVLTQARPTLVVLYRSTHIPMASLILRIKPTVHQSRSQALRRARSLSGAASYLMHLFPFPR